MSIGNKNPNAGRFKKGISGNPSGLRKDGTAPAHPPANPPQLSEEEMVRRLDGWSSVFTGIGHSSYDKRLSHSFQAPTLTYQEKIELWRADDIAARAIEKVPEQCFRQGYEIEMGDEGEYNDLRLDLEELFRDLCVDDRIEMAMKQERAFGGSAILLGVDDGRGLDTPLIPERVKKIEWLKVLEPIELTPETAYADPRKPKYGEPEKYRLRNGDLAIQRAVAVTGKPPTRSRPTPIIHESRLIIFPGIRVSNYQANTASQLAPFWGDGILIRLIEVLRDFNVVWHGAGIVGTDFAQSVISIDNLMGLVSKDPEKLIARARALEMSRSTARAVMIDTKEKYERHSTSLAGLPDLLEKMSRRLAAAIDMPLSILMGAGEMGIGKDGLSDVRHYYDGIAAIQRRRVGPILRQLIKLAMPTLRKRKIPPRWDIKFNPLWQLTDQEKAEARLTQARADVLYTEALIFSPNEIRDSRARGGFSFDTQIDESQTAPDMKKAIEMYEEKIKKPEPGAAGVSVTPHTRSKPAVAGEGKAKPKGGGATAGRGQANRDGEESDADAIMERPAVPEQIGRAHV